mmetsp:Transcript_104367/g.332013  ORF Transcript_104367/g.332013 Transcript_104367/m.332013 type:complete len:354 (-) Transcript_104367:142-1203(-)
MFSDEDNSRHLGVAIGPESGRPGEEYVVRVWSCETAGSLSPPEDDPRPAELKQKEGFVSSLDDHKAVVRRMATNKTYLLTADAAGECKLWQKSRAFAKRGTALLHAGGVSDLAVDRFFAYSVGTEDRRICAWALPDLSPILAVPVDIPGELLAGLTGSCPRAEPSQPAPSDVPATASTPAASSMTRQPAQLARVNLLRRPPSRWAGWQGSGRGPKAPRGSLFAAGVLREGCEVAGAGAGVLMEWSLGDKPCCQSVQIAHDSPIVALVYGPYDNGPLISADSKGVFRVWESLLDRGLCFMQQIELACPANGCGSLPCPAVAVEQPRGLYVASGARKLHVWQRHQDASNGGLSRM